MKAFVDKDRCIGCGLCAELCPEVFAMDDDDLAGVIVDEIDDADIEAAEEARESCPTEAISIEEE